MRDGFEYDNHEGYFCGGFNLAEPIRKLTKISFTPVLKYFLLIKEDVISQLLL